MQVSVQTIETGVHDMQLRMPFHFGNTTVSQLPHLFMGVDVSFKKGARPTRGLAAEGLSPMWFIKDPGVTFADGLNRMIEVIESAIELAQELPPQPSVFDFWHRLFEKQRQWADRLDHPPLLWSFGVSLVERGIIDAYCRHHGTTFGDAVRETELGIDLGALHPELVGESAADLLPEKSRQATALRHTVGFTDPLTEGDLEPDNRLDDGLPQALTTYVREQGISYFKVKLSGDAGSDADRLEELDAVLTKCDLESYVITLDANEQFGDARSFKNQWKTIRRNETLDGLFDHLLYVEQPLARTEAMTDDAARVFADWDDRPPIIIDESDEDLDSLRRALECGYNGTSHKNCKGVFKGVVNACLVEYRRRNDPSGTYAMSGEDLTTVGPVSLLQDLAVMATIGMTHVERNGHHYFKGLSMIPDDLQESLLTEHGDLYRRHEDGFATLDVADGGISLESVVDAPFGYDIEVDLDRFTPLQEWEFE